MSAELILRGFQGTLEIAPDAVTLRDEALKLGSEVIQVTNDKEQLTAVEALRKLKAISKGMEASRKAIKAPVLQLGKEIDTTASDFLMGVIKEAQRIEGIINHFQIKQLQATRDQEAETKKSEQTADQLRAEAQALRAKAMGVSIGNEKASLIERANELEQKAMELILSDEGAIVSQQLAAPKPKGLVVRKRWNFQLINPILFIQGYPQFFKWNEDTETFKLKRQDILDEINKEGGGLFHRSHFPEELPAKAGDPVAPPGMRVFEDIKSHVR